MSDTLADDLGMGGDGPGERAFQNDIDKLSDGTLKLLRSVLRQRADRIAYLRQDYNDTEKAKLAIDALERGGEDMNEAGVEACCRAIARALDVPYNEKAVFAK